MNGCVHWNNYFLSNVTVTCMSVRCGLGLKYYSRGKIFLKRGVCVDIMHDMSLERREQCKNISPKNCSGVVCIVDTAGHAHEHIMTY